MSKPEEELHNRLIQEIIDSPKTPKEYAAKEEILRLRRLVSGEGEKTASKSRRGKDKDSNESEE